MTLYLLVYRRSTGTLVSVEDLGADRDRALKRRFAAEKLYKDDPDVEVVVLGASDLDSLKRTHARYFRSVEQLARALGEAVPR